MSDSKCVVVLIIVCLLVVTYGNPIGMKSDLVGTMVDPLFDLSYYNETVIIENNEELVDLGLPGNGSEANPFILANLTIADYGPCIEIKNTDLYLLVTNCTIMGEFQGLKLVNTTNIVIKYVNVAHIKHGIEISQSQNIIIEDCIFDDCVYGFDFDESTYSLVSKCVFKNIGEQRYVTPTGGTIYPVNDGLVGEVTQSENITIENNSCTNLDDAWGAFNIYGCTNLKLIDNQVDNTDWGIWFEGCSGCSFFGNAFGECWVVLYGNLELMFSEVHSNTIQGKDLGIIQNQHNSILDGETLKSAVLISCTNITVSGGDLSNTASGLGFWNCTNCSMDGIISSTYFNIHKSKNCSISSSTIGKTAKIVSSEGTTILNCNFSNIAQANPSIYIETSNITKCVNNSIIACKGGILLYKSLYTDLITNWIESVEDTGIIVMNSQHGTIIGNSILGSKMKGIVLEHNSTNFEIYYNIIGWNTEGNVVDDGYDNIWDDGISRGNNYSDYVGSGVYHINGDAESIDHFPGGISSGYWNISTDELPNYYIITILTIGIAGVGLVTITVIWVFHIRRK